MENSGEERDPLEISLREQLLRGPFLVAEGQINRMADELYRQAGFCDLESLATVARCEIHRVPTLPAKFAAVLTPRGLILVRDHADSARVTLVAFHELARWLLRCRAHSCADVWRLALALAAPGSTCYSARIPAWAMNARSAASAVAAARV